MAHNARIHTAVTGWPTGYVVTQADLLAIDTLLFQSLNADLGGTWAPASVITIGGAGLSVTTTLFGATISGDALNITGNTSILGTLDVGVGAFVASSGGIALTVNTTFSFGTVSFENGLTVPTGNIVVTTGGIDVQAGELHVVGNVQFDANLSVAGASTLNSIAASSINIGASAITADNTALTVGGGVAANFSGLMTIAGGAALTSVLAASGTGRTRKRPPVTLPDSNVTIGINDGDMFLVPALGATRTLTLSTVGASEGDVMEFSAYANSTLNAMNMFGGGVGLFNGVAGVLYIKILFTGGAWVTLGHVRY